MDVGVVGVRSKQGPYMPTMQISGRGFGLGLCFASSQTFRINRSIMAREGRIASNRCHPMAGKVKFDSDNFPLMAREQRIVSHHKSLMSRTAKVASNGKEMGERNVYKQANYQQVRRMHDNHRPAKVSEEKCIDVSEGRCFEVIVSGPGHTHSKVLRGGFVEQKYSQDPNSMSSGCLVGQNYYQQPNRMNSRWVVRPNYSQQPNITRSRWVSEQNSSRQSDSMNSRLESGRPSCNTARMGEWNMSRNVVIQDFPSKGNEIQELYTDSKISITEQKSESNCHQTTQDELDWNRTIQGIREKTSRNCIYVAETQRKHNYKVDVPPSLKKQPESEDVSVEKQEREPQCTIKSVPIHSSSRPFESAEKSKNDNRERGVGESKDVSVEKQEQETQGTIKSGPIHSSRRSIESAEKSKHDNREKGVGERKNNASQVSASDKVTSEISESKGGNIHSSSRPFEPAEKSKHDNRERGVGERKYVSVENQEQETQGTIKSSPIHSSRRSIESAEKSKHDNREKGIGESKDNATQVSASDKVASEISESKGGNIEDRLKDLFKQVLVVKKVKTAKLVVSKLMGEYRNLVHACDTEVAGINVKKESPVGHGKLICFSIYCGSNADFDGGKSCVWVDVLDGDKNLLSVFAPYFEDSSIRKVFHNYSFDRHIIENHGINVCGFYADTMHLARLWNSARREEGGYSLESLTKDPKVMDGIGMAGQDQMIEGKLSMKALFGKNKVKKDGSEGKTITIAPVEELQRTERDKWICYSALDSMSTWKLWKSLQTKLKDTEWTFQDDSKRTMYDFYEEYWRPFGDLLVKMESKGMLVNREYLSKREEVAKLEQEKSAARFRHWASSYCPDAKYMNVGSDTQVRQLLFGGMPNKKDPNQSLPVKRTIKVPNVDNFIDQGKKAPLKLRNIELHGLGVNMEVEHYTVSGWPAVSSAALKVLAGKVPIDYEDLAEDSENEFTEDLDDGLAVLTSSGVKNVETAIENKEGEDISVYGTAYNAFGGGEKGRKACQAIAALCEVNSINTLISNFLLPLQGEEISGKDGRVHCSLNINTETGRLSARNPNLQNQPALEKDRYKIRQAFIANSGNALIVADYGQLELRILAHLSNCRSMLDAFKAGGDFHSRTAMNMYAHVRDAVEKKNVLLEWDPQPGEEKPPIPLLKDVFASERRKAKMLNFSIAYGKTALGLSKDWKVSLMEAKETVNLWYNERKEVLQWQEERKHEARTKQCVHTLLGRARHLPCTKSATLGQKGHIERAAINTPVQGSAADVAMCAMLEISRNARLKELGWTLVLQVHDEVILEGPAETAEEAKALVVNCMSYPFYGKNILQVDLAVDAKYASNWYEAK